MTELCEALVDEEDAGLSCLEWVESVFEVDRAPDRTMEAGVADREWGGERGVAGLLLVKASFSTIVGEVMMTVGRSAGLVDMGWTR